ncbi:beta-lactamase family protein [Candidatus Sumerlaeota bacterium]|nr:beta-lactamase family protein [Candidatus Sumerlaeota bacterium]
MRIAASILLLALAVTGCATRPMTPSLVTRIEAMVREKYPSDSDPGCSVLVVDHGRRIFEKSYGVASLEDNIPATPETNYRIASVTKQFTAMAVLLLADKGMMSLDDSVRDHIPEMPAYAQPITIRHLLNHTSGLKDYEDLYDKGITVPLLDADVVKLLAAQESGDFAPGEKYSYSNSGYAMLAIIVERVSGRKFAQFLHDEIFEPLGMRNSVAFEAGVSEVPHRAFGYKREGAGWKFADQSMTSSVLGDGGIYTSLVDYAKWDEALRDGKLLSPPLLQEAYTAGKLNDGSALKYGYGWKVEDKNGMKEVWHTGSTTGFNHATRRIPQLGLCVVVFSNREGEEPAKLAVQIEDLVLNADSSPR